jgi:REP element-mobilizing transposase RayT
MPRPRREQFAGAIYHLMARGVRGEPLFTDEREPADFLRLLSQTCARYDWLVHAYCLMGNHYHLLATTRKPTVSRGMQWLNSRYAESLNARHGHEGHAFFRRFHAVLIKSEAQLADVARYILLNPVDAQLCDTPGDWRWSSYRATIGEAPRPAFLELGSLLGEFGLEPGRARANLAAFIREAE